MRRVSFLVADDGAVTVNWVVMTAGIVGLGVAVVTAVSDGTSSLGHDIADTLSDVEIVDEDYKWKAHDPDADHWWTNQELREERYAGLNDSQLDSHWSRHLNEFDTAVAAGDNSACHGCKGAGNRLDSLQIVHQERVARGMATQEDAKLMADARNRYGQVFGN